jgi:hypothetical protein
VLDQSCSTDIWYPHPCSCYMKSLSSFLHRNCCVTQDLKMPTRWLYTAVGANLIRIASRLSIQSTVANSLSSLCYTALLRHTSASLWLPIQTYSCGMHSTRDNPWIYNLDGGLVKVTRCNSLNRLHLTVQSFPWWSMHVEWTKIRARQLEKPGLGTPDSQ